MTSQEIVRSAIQHKESPVIPRAITLTGEAQEKYGCDLLADYGTRQICEDFHEGRLDLSQAISLAIGNHIVDVGPPWWNWFGLTEEFTKCEDTPQGLPQSIGCGSYEKFFEQIAYLRKTYNPYILVTVWGSHWEKAYFARGIENFLADLAADPEWSQRLLDTIIRKNMVMLENFVSEEEIDGVLLGSDWGSQKDLLMSPDCWRNMILPGEKREYELVHAHGKDVFVHSCGCVLRILGELAEAGVDVLNPVQPECMDLDFLKENFGAGLTFYGGISTQTTLPFGTPEQVAAEVRNVAKKMSRGGGYILSPSQGIQADVSYENIRALIDAAREN